MITETAGCIIQSKQFQNAKQKTGHKCTMIKTRCRRGYKGEAKAGSKNRQWSKDLAGKELG